MTREDLNELHALAASISADRRGWRAHRRDRSLEAARRRLEAEMLAPGKRRRRHRWIAGVAVSVLAIAGGVMIVMHLPGKAAPPPKRTLVEVRHLPAPVNAGQRAAIALTTRGQLPSVFSCEQIYDTEHMGSVPGQQGPAWHSDYLEACMNAPSPSGGAGN